MAPVVRSDSQETSADGEAKEANERVSKADSIQIKARAISNHGPHVFLRA
jgi:hypothetical protein